VPNYTEQLFADPLVHGWDLARAIGLDEAALDPALVESCSAWFTAWEDGYRGAGVIGPRAAPGTSGDAERLLAAFGR
jgi:hypothetical protein